jgi:peptidylprolyl isomerase
MANPKLIALVLIGSTILMAVLTMWYETRHNTNNQELVTSEEKVDGPLVPEEQKVNNPVISSDMNPTALIKTNKGVIELELFQDLMPITVGNFVSLAESGFYDGTKFHRVIENFMIQGGDPNTKGDNEAIYGTGGPEKNVQDEFVADPKLTNVRGTIAMANTGQPNSGGSQWFINLVDNLGLDFDKDPASSKHPVFGQVVNGMDVVDNIGSVDTKPRDIPAEPIIIETIEIVRK